MFKKQTKKIFQNHAQGQVVILTVIFFILISGVVIAAVSIPTSNQIKSSRDYFKAKQSYAAADSVNDDALYLLNQGKTLPASIVLSFSNNVSGTAQVTTVGSLQQITTTGTSDTSSRIAKSIFSQSSGTSFNYGLQIGTGGITMTSGTINGSVYSNGDFTGNQSSIVTGSVTVANTSDPVADQSNLTITPTYNLTFGDTTVTSDIAQSFRVSTSTTLTNIGLYIKKTGSPANATIRISSDASGKPNNNTLASGVLSASLVGTSYGYVQVPITSSPTLNTSNTYWIVIDTVSPFSASNTYTIGATNATYANGVAKIGQHNNTTWSATTPSTADLVFDVYMGGHNGTITSSSGSQWNPITIGGLAWAHEIDYAKVTGVGYCEASNYLMTSAGVAKNCDNSRADPVQLSFPVSDANIQDWKDTVTDTTDLISGGWAYTGNLTIGSSGTTTTTLRRVNGNLTLSCSTASSLGDIYVTGTLSVSNGCTATLNTVNVGNNLSISGGTLVTIGTTKVAGNVSVSGGSTLKLKGTLWAVGNTSLSGGSYLKLDSSLGARDGLIVSDGNLDNTGGGIFDGSGTSGSYIMAVTTSTSPTAVQLSGGSGAVVVVAPYGTVVVSGGAAAKSITAYRMNISGNSTVTYDTGLASLDFSTGASGSWGVDSWSETEN